MNRRYSNLTTQKAKLKTSLESCSRKYLDFLVAKKQNYEDLVLMDLLKTFETPNRDLFAAKLHAYSFSNRICN